MYTISKSFEFAAAHRLPYVDANHPCAREHGHNYVVTLHLEAEELDHRGFVVDYNDMKEFKRWLDDTLDHRHLNDIIVNPTAELIAKWVHEAMPRKGWYDRIYKVTVKETASTEATYTPPR